MHDDWPDDKLYHGLIERDPSALEALIQRYSREMSYFIRLVLEGVGTPQDAEECAQDLFVAVWQEIETFDAVRGSLRTWLTMRAKYIALDRRRQVQRRQQALTSLDAGAPSDGPTGEARALEQRAGTLLESSMEGLLEQRERREELRKALELLPALDRTLVYLRYFQLATTEQIATKTGLTRHAIDTRLWRARKLLREALEELAHGRIHAG